MISTSRARPLRGALLRTCVVSTLALGAAGCSSGSVASAGAATAAGVGGSSSTTSGVGGSSATTAGAGGAGTTAATTSAASTSGAGGASCPSCGAAAASGALQDPEMNEISGIVASHAHPGVFYVQNDSGDAPRFFAIDASGKRLATLHVKGASAIDWEDIGLGPCPSGTCVYLADIGDNAEMRGMYTIYRVAEPDVIADADVTGDAIAFAYPDGSHNAETLLVHPTSGALTIVTKVFVGASSIFELPAPATPGAKVIATKVGEVKPPDGSVLFTGGDVHPSAKGVLLRTYSNVWLYPMSPGDAVSAALAGSPCAMPVAKEAQGEAIGWTAAGDGYVTVSEGDGSPIDAVGCEGP